MPIFGQKHVNSVKTIPYYRSNKSIGCPFFMIFYEKITTLMRIFVIKTYILERTHSSHAHIWSENRPFFLKTLCSRHFFQNFHEKPPAHMPIFGKKNPSILSKHYYIFGQKINRMPFFLIFYVKTTSFMPIFCQKNVCSLKNTMLSFPYFVKKRPSKTLCSHVISSKFS